MLTPAQKNEIQQLIETGQIGVAIDRLNNLDLPAAYQQRAVELSARHQQFRQEKARGTLSFEQQQLTQNRLLADLTDLLNGRPADPSTPTPSKTWKYIAAAALIVGMLGSLAEILNFIDLFPAKQQVNQLTVFVLDEKGNPALVNEARLNIPLGNRSLNASVGENGRTNFADITADNIGDSLRIGLDAPGWEIVRPRGAVVFNGKPIQITVQPDNSLGRIQGVVKSRDGQNFIAGALIRVNSDTIVLTNEYGMFKITLPTGMRVQKNTERYKLSVSKEGYQTRVEHFTPGSSDAEIRLDPQ